ncbi:MAG TPA: F0F1 ATP synthase subunit B [Marmoricola sp.]|nr:F0F1 ATP synthase subunit B [Marmoricola sp.]
MTFTQTAGLLAADNGPSPLMPHLAELIVGLVAFALLFLFLRAKVFPRFEQVYQERRESIAGGIQKAEAAQAEAQAALEQYRAQLAEARQEASRIRAEAQEQGAAIVAEMRTEAQAQASRIVEQARAQVEADRSQAFASLQAQVGEISTRLASRIVGESLEDEARQRRVVERFLAELESGASANGSAANGGASVSGETVGSGR